MKKKVRITSMGMNGLNKDQFPYPTKNGFAGPKDKGIRKTVTGDEYPNVEAEGGETLWDDRDKDGIPEHYKISGDRHYDGGVELNMSPKGFVFSDTKDMKIKDPAILALFGETKAKTPADIAKKYDLNDAIAILKDDKSDKIQRASAERQINEYNMMLGKLALVQESKKGFKGGVPNIAETYLNSVGIDPASLDPHQYAMQNTAMKYGGQMMADGGGDPNKNYQHINREDYNRLNQNYEITYGPEQGNFKSQTYDPTQGAYTWKDQSGKKKLLDMEDFKNRHGHWVVPEYSKMYGKDANFFNDLSSKNASTREQAAGFFQKSYDNFLEQNGVAPYFKGKGTNDPYGYDNKFGVYTFSAPGFKKRETQAAPPPAKEVQYQLDNPKTPPVDTGAPTINHFQPTYKNDTPDQYWLQDKIRQAGNARDYLTLKKYMPWQATPDVAMVQGTFYDPNREIAATQETANIMGQNLSTFAGPQVSSARTANIQGTAAKQIADTLGNYENRNVGVANNLDAMNAQIYNQASSQRAGLATQLFDKTTIANQQYDNSKRQILHNMDDTAIAAETNRAYTHNLNMLYPQFAVHPEIGGNISYTGVPGNITPTYNDPDALAKRYTELKKKGITDEATLRFLLGDKTPGQQNQSGNPDMEYLRAMGYPG